MWADKVGDVASLYDGTDEREAEVADMARRAAQAASDRRKRIRATGTGFTAEDVDADALARLDHQLEDLAAWSPGFAGAMLFRGAEVLPLVSLITAADREAMKRALVHVAVSIRAEMELIERDAVGSFVDSVTSTSRGAVIVTVLNNDILVVALEGKPAAVADAWKAITERKAAISSAAGAFFHDAADS